MPDPTGNMPDAVAVATHGPTLHCPACGYNLTALTRRQCPECGTPFDPRQLRAMAVAPQRPTAATSIGLLAAPILINAAAVMVDLDAIGPRIDESIVILYLIGCIVLAWWIATILARRDAARTSWLAAPDGHARPSRLRSVARITGYLAFQFCIAVGIRVTAWYLIALAQWF